MLWIIPIRTGFYSLDMEKPPRLACQDLVPRCKDRDMDVRVSVRGDCLKGLSGRRLNRHQEHFPKSW